MSLKFLSFLKVKYVIKIFYPSKGRCQKKMEDNHDAEPWLLFYRPGHQSDISIILKAVIILKY